MVRVRCGQGGGGIGVADVAVFRQLREHRRCGRGVERDALGDLLYRGDAVDQHQELQLRRSQRGLATRQLGAPLQGHHVNPLLVHASTPSLTIILWAEVGNDCADMNPLKQKLARGELAASMTVRLVSSVEIVRIALGFLLAAATGRAQQARGLKL